MEGNDQKLHICSGDLPIEGSYGPAITDCREDEDGKFWAAGDEYGSQVVFCPYCGKKSPNPPQIENYKTEKD